MTRIADFKSSTEDGFVPALNEELKETRRRLERQHSKFQRIEGIKVQTAAGTGTQEVPHELGVVPKEITTEFYDNNFVVIGYYKPHTAEKIFVRVFSASNPTNIVLVLRG